MRKLVTKLLKTISLFLLILCSLQVNAQNSFFNFTIANDHQISDRILEFDLYLLDTDAGATFELGTVQAGITVNPGIYNGGTISVEIVAASSELVNWQQPNTFPTTLWSQSQNAIKLTSRTPIGSGTILSQTTPGTRVCRLRMTNNVPFTSNSTANLTFNFTVSPYPTKVSQYILGINTPLSCNATNCYSNAANMVLNPPITAFAVTGGGSYCQGSGGLPVGLVNSENGITYTLLKDGMPQVPEVIGTGSAINFGNQLYGTYTVSGSNIGGSTQMTGNAVLSEILNPPTPIITSIDNYLESSSVSGNQWYNSSGKIFGETGQRYIPPSNGNYFVVVINDEGCISEPSNTISFTTQIEKNEVFKGISVYPIPATGNLIIENNTNLSSIDFEIINSIGRKIYTSMLGNISIVDLNRFPPGIYYLIFTNEGFYYRFKFIKQ